MSEPTIHTACQQGDLAAVQACLAADPATVDADDQYEWRPIFHAALWRHEEIVRLLVEAGADVAAHDGYVLHYAGQVPNNKAIVTLLLQHGALEAYVKPGSDLVRQFLAAVFLGDAARVRSLIALHADLPNTPDGREDYAIHHAARNGDLEVAGALLAGGADVNAIGAGGNTVLYCAGGHRHADLVQSLLDAGADPHAKFTKDGKDLVEWLAQYPDDPSYRKIADILARHGHSA